MSKSVIKLGGRTVVAMVHVPTLHGAPEYDIRAGMQKLHDWVSWDLEALQYGEGSTQSCSGMNSTGPMSSGHHPRDWLH